MACVGIVVAASACSCGNDSGRAAGGADSGPAAVRADGGASKAPPAGREAGSKVVLVSQSTFTRADSGQYTTPGPARLIVLRQQGARWEQDVIEDSESTVFHKGMVIAGAGQEPVVATIGGKRALLKLWRRTAEGWRSETVWGPAFGGENDRLRDMELADVTGDGQPEIVLATHDQGVVAVVRRVGDRWEPQEIDREADIFVHEVEVGDVDGNGVAEIFATPSRPNRGTGGPQPGKVVRYQWNGERFDREVVADWDRTHAKEILVADLDGTGGPELYASLEGETEGGLCGFPGAKVISPAKILRIERSGGSWSSREVASVPDECLCRFLLAGDLDGDRGPELVAAAFKQGLWMFEPGSELPMKGRNLTRDTGGFEHASVLADGDGDGTPELYVADDDHGRVLRYRWTGGQLGDPEVLLTRTVPRSAITWNLWVGELP
jgi:hypothetical protein